MNNSFGYKINSIIKFFILGIAVLISVSLQAEQCIQESLSLRMTLGSQRSVSIAKSSVDSHFVLNMSALEAVDPDAWIKITEEQDSATNTLLSRMVVSVPYSSPSFQKIIVAVQELNLENVLLNVHRLEIEVVPELKIHFYGNDSGSTVFESPDTIQLQPHDRPVMVRFINSRDNGSQHRIHGEGAIIHAPRSSILSKVGDTYEFEMTNKDLVEGRYYCHVHDTRIETKRIRFNVTDIQELKGAIQFPDTL